MGVKEMTPGQIAAGGVLRKMRAHSFEVGTALVFMLIGANYSLDPQAGERSQIGESLLPYSTFWTAFYVIAAPLIIIGLARESQRLRVAGLIILGTGLTMNWIAAMAIEPFELRDFTYFCFAVTCFIQALLGAETVTPVVKRRARRN